MATAANVKHCPRIPGGSNVTLTIRTTREVASKVDALAAKNGLSRAHLLMKLVNSGFRALPPSGEIR